MYYLQTFLGVILLLGIAWGISRDRKSINWRLIATSIVLQLILAALLLKVRLLQAAFALLNDAVFSLQAATAEGTAFVFGYLGGGALPFPVTDDSANFILAFQSLPLILVIGALSALLWYWRVLPAIVNAFAWLLERTLGVGGAVGVSTAANVFIGMVEAPLLVRPYMAKLSHAEMFMVMTVGMSTIAGTVLVLYATAISAILDNAVGHLLIASIISAPAAIMFALIMIPATGDEKVTQGEPEISYASSMEAVTRGTQEALTLFLYIIAMLVVLVSLVALVNNMLGLLPEMAGAPVTFQRILGIIMAPFVWLLGIPWQEAAAAGQLMGTKIVLNEFLAYLQMAALPPDTLSPRSVIIMSYALCGFANFGSLGIMLAGLIAMVPGRRAEISDLGMYSMVSGVLATSFTGAIAGLLL